jgi:hypothetical protein
MTLPDIGWRNELGKARHKLHIPLMSTTALRIVQLVKSLPPDEQRAVSAALAPLYTPTPVPRPTASGPFRPEDYVGLPDDDPFFKVMEEIERERHARTGPLPPDLD